MNGNLEDGRQMYAEYQCSVLDHRGIPAPNWETMTREAQWAWESMADKYELRREQP